MKTIKRIFFFIFIILLISPVLVLAYFGFVPGLSKLFGSDKPRNLQISYTKADYDSARAQSKIEYGQLPDNTSEYSSIQRIGTREVKMELTSSQATSLMNDRPWKYWPYKEVQVRFNSDGSAEVSGRVIKSKLPSYAAAIGIPKEAVAFAMKFLPVDPVFYLKMRASLKDNKVDIFDPQKFEIGRVPMPISLFLAKNSFVKKVYAMDIGGMASELAKVDNKKDLIISYINGRLSGYTEFFYAKSAYFTEDKFIFDGRLAEKEMTVK